MLPHTDTAGARAVSERIRQTLSGMSLKDVSGETVLKPTVSQGIATYPDSATSGDDLVNKADAALYEAKAGGRDRISLTTAAAPGEQQPPREPVE